MRTLPKFERGFTLIELMIVVLVIAIIAAIAYPNYTEHVRKTRRAEGQAALAELSNRLERCFTRFNSYTACDGLDALSSENGWYEVAAVRTDTTFALTATPQRAQSDDKCGNLTLNHIGVRGTSVTPPSGTHCW
jgi:type IV pilus assembly protein PilE